MRLKDRLMVLKYLLIIAAGYISISYYTCFKSKAFSIFLIIMCTCVLIMNIMFDIGLENIKTIFKDKIFKNKQE